MTTTWRYYPDPADAVPSFAIQRVPMPEWIRLPHPHEDSVYEDATGEQLEWGFAIPWVFKALASPLTHEPVLAAPRGGRDQKPALAYWSALLTLLIYSLGWARPDRGLRWWYDAGKPTDDPRLQLISQVWDADGQLDWFAAWLWTTPYSVFDVGSLAALTGYRDDGLAVRVDERWIKSTLEAANAWGPGTPCGPSSDNLHLSGHSRGPLAELRTVPRLLRSRPNDRRATLMLDSMVGWYRALAVSGSTLPEIGGRSWRVDVVARPVGHLGTYRRSRRTGLWFAGHHRHHVQGT